MSGEALKSPRFSHLARRNSAGEPMDMSPHPELKHHGEHLDFILYHTQQDLDHVREYANQTHAHIIEQGSTLAPESLVLRRTTSRRHQPSTCFLTPTGSINLGFLLRETCCCTHHTFHLGVPNERVLYASSQGEAIKLLNNDRKALRQQRANNDATITRLRAKIAALEATVKDQEEQMKKMEEDGEDIQGGSAFLSDDDDFEEDGDTEEEDYEFLDAGEDEHTTIDVDEDEE
ncbi:hypothetical protein QYE76_014432 [Lolium multiflorum]|uniref:Uncharacterized protein n=1 Tax=Lolium multiflorum TaxID=4521 RepID=A0AAD8U0N8_LOLMU|nr:hypothetical protein QYE76_014432 [Lolium multiflorum]